MIFYKGKTILVGDDTIRWISQDSTEIWGVVRHRIDASLEKSIPFDGDKQVGGIPINVGQSLEVDPEPMVEIPNGQTCGASPPNDQL